MNDRADFAPADVWTCEHVVTELRLMRVHGGGIQYRRQCQRCGHSVGNAVRADSLAVVPPEWDEALRTRWDDERRAYYEARRRQFEDSDSAERTAWRDRYEAVMASTDWQARRQSVLQRERYICQGCRAARACEVHHLTYTHLGHELLFQLAALCPDCHERAHGHHGDSGGDPRKRNRAWQGAESVNAVLPRNSRDE